MKSPMSIRSARAAGRITSLCADHTQGYRAPCQDIATQCALVRCGAWRRAGLTGDDAPHIHAVVAPTYLRKARVPGKQKRGETPEQFEERRATARASEGIRTVGRASHPTLSKQGSFQRLRERMTIAVDHLGIEYGADRAIDTPDGQSTREYVIQEAARIRAEQADLGRERKTLAQEREDSLNEALEDAKQMRREATPARFKKLEKENAELRKTNKSLNDFVDSIRNTLSAALGDRWEVLKKKINDTWKADPRHPNYKPEPPSQSYSSGPSGP